MDNTLNQLYEGMTFLYGGFTAGIVYELLAIVRRHSARRVWTGVCDALFAAYATLCAAVCFVIATGGVLRPFGFLLMLLGWLLARWAFQPLFRML